MPDPIKFQDGEPPRDSTKQYLAWAIDLHGRGQNKAAAHPRWMAVQWNTEWTTEWNHGYWSWSVPGMSTAVRILRWAELPEMDHWAVCALERMGKATCVTEEPKG